MSALFLLPCPGRCVRAAVALLLFWLTPATASVFEHPATADTLARVLAPAAQPLAAAHSVRGSYRQTRTLAGLPHALSAEGDFLFVRDLGIAWRTRLPFASELVITPEALVQRTGAGEQRVDAAQQPAVRTIAAVFLAVFALDFDTLDDLFLLFAQADGDDGWRLGLRPLQASGTLDEIEISGRDRVERVLLHERGGDRTQIELLDTKISQSTPSADERALFGRP